MFHSNEYVCFILLTLTLSENKMILLAPNFLNLIRCSFSVFTRKKSLFNEMCISYSSSVYKLKLSTMPLWAERWILDMNRKLRTKQLQKTRKLIGKCPAFWKLNAIVLHFFNKMATNIFTLSNAMLWMLAKSLFVSTLSVSSCVFVWFGCLN